MKLIPPRPDNPAALPECSAEHWYDKEFSGWQTGKKKQLLSPGDGPAGKRIYILHPGDHPYQRDYIKSMRRTAARYQIRLTVRNARWNPELQEKQVERVIQEKPDMVILVPVNNDDSSRLYRRVYEARIPLIASNMLPRDEGFPYILCWTGPDDWEQTRHLSRRFAELMDHKGGYAIVTHRPGTSPYYARAWGAITELKKQAPDMELLEMDHAELKRQETCDMVFSWLMKHGTRLKGILSADDSITQLGINDALKKYGKGSLIRAANGSTSVGINLLRRKELHVITWQDPEMDGRLPIEMAVDWFRGLEIPPLKYLPVQLIEKKTIQRFLRDDRPYRDLSEEQLHHDLLNRNRNGILNFFDSFLMDYMNHPATSDEFTHGYCIDILAELISLIKEEELDRLAITGDHENIYKQLIQQKSKEDLILWLKSLCFNIIDALEGRLTRDMGSQMLDYINKYYVQPLSLKVLAQHFDRTASYLGKKFIMETGEPFSSYLNRYRVEKACQLLKTRRISASRAGREVGFSSSSYFFRTFQRIMNQTPSEYINSSSDHPGED